MFLSQAFYVFLCALSLSNGVVVGKRAAATAPIEEPRYLALHAWYNFDNFTEFVDAGAEAGFNVIRLTADWAEMEKDPRSMPDFSQLDDKLAYVIETKKLSAMITIWLRRPSTGNDPVLARTEEMANFTGSVIQGNDVAEISFGSQTALETASGFIRAVINRYYPMYGPKIVCYLTVASGFAELEYWSGGMYDYSQQVVNDFRVWLKAFPYPTIADLNSAWGTSYNSFDEVQPPQDFVGAPGKCWYQHRHRDMLRAISALSYNAHFINQSDPSLRHAVQWGSTYDVYSRLRGTIAFPSLLDPHVDVVWVDDAPDYPHAYAMDLMRSSVGGRWIANEIDSPLVGSDEEYYDLAATSFNHGANIVSVANWNLEYLLQRQNLFRRIANDFLGKPVAKNDTVANLEVSALQVFQQGDSTAFINKYNQLSQNGKLWVNVTLIDDLSWQ